MVNRHGRDRSQESGLQTRGLYPSVSGKEIRRYKIITTEEGEQGNEESREPTGCDEITRNMENKEVYKLVNGYNFIETNFQSYQR